jgi:hypothetical protein
VLDSDLVGSSADLDLRKAKIAPKKSWTFLQNKIKASRLNFILEGGGGNCVQMYSNKCSHNWKTPSMQSCLKYKSDNKM